jgi:hypothetical protein
VFDEGKVENALAQFKLLKMRESKAYAIAIELQIGNDCKKTQTLPIARPRTTPEHRIRTFNYPNTRLFEFQLIRIGSQQNGPRIQRLDFSAFRRSDEPREGRDPQTGQTRDTRPSVYFIIPPTTIQTA